MRTPFGLLATMTYALLHGCGDSPPATDTVRFGTNDVSVLLPLPAQFSDVDQLLPLSTLGNGGPLLSPAMFAQIPMFANRPNNPGLYSAWHVVGARIDPCFPDLALLTADPSKCRRQLRLISQSISNNGPADSGPPGVLNVDDAALHLFFEFDSAQFNALASEWLALSSAQSRDPALPLGVHPVIAVEGLTGPTYQALVAIIKKYAGSATLAQFTAMDGRTVAWEFAGFTPVGDTLTELAIHGVAPNYKSQTISADNLEIFSIAPETTASRNLAALAGEYVNTGGVGGGAVKLTASQAALDAALKLTLTIDDPTQQFNPESLDCVSCHLAGRARDRATKLGGNSSGMDRFTNARNLTLGGSRAPNDSVRQQRAFGYRDTFTSINQRVVNESAAVADALEVMFPLYKE
ncbi:MAG: hypothetical protein KBG15_01610 [Kofleriaceae bacterium]|nr:hypothetical protein [Kofleriaceae bacterium]